MSKKGFTLIELLAIIIILAIIALIAVPAVLNIIDKSKEKTLESSAHGLIGAADLYYIEGKNNSETETFKGPDYEGLKLKGEKIEEGEITITSDGKVSMWLYKDKCCVYKRGNKKEMITASVESSVVCEKLAKGIIENGTMVYFNPVSGLKCKESDYTESQSSGTANTGCLKWYILNDKEGKNTVDMILDHNTSYGIKWNSSGSNSETPNEILTRLGNDTSSWHSSLNRSDSYIDPAKGYVIDYTNYKARLIEANEVRTITESTNKQASWDSASSTTSLYFDGRSLTGQGTSKYPWLYDYTNNCISYGCNIVNSNTYGYWTSSANASGSDSAWGVYRVGSMFSFNVIVNNGIRPVITISKSNISNE